MATLNLYPARHTAPEVIDLDFTMVLDAGNDPASVDGKDASSVTVSRSDVGVYTCTLAQPWPTSAFIGGTATLLVASGETLDGAVRIGNVTSTTFDVCFVKTSDGSPVNPPAAGAAEVATVLVSVKLKNSGVI